MAPTAPLPRASALAALAVLLLLVDVAGAAFKLPPEFKRCSKADLRAKNNCLREAVDDALPRLRHGLPRMGVPPLDPLVIPQVAINQEGNGVVKIALVFNDFTTRGVLDGIKINMVDVDLDKLIVAGEVLVPHVVVDSNYTAEGRVMVMPIRGGGACKFVMSDLLARFTIKGVRETKKDGKEYVDFDNASISFKPKKLQLQMNGLFGGDKALGENMNRMLNANWELIYAELSDSMNTAYGEIIKHYARGLFRHVSIDDLFPDTLP